LAETHLIRPLRKHATDPYLTPEHERSALITIDVQRDTLDGGPLEIPGTSSSLPNMCRLAQWFRQQSRPIVHVVRLYERDGSNVDLCRKISVEQGSELLLAGSAGSQLAAALLPRPDMIIDDRLLLSGRLQPIGAREWLMYKPRWGAFFRTCLEEHLRGLGVTTLVFAGCNFPNCPRTSIYEASERDFRLIIVEDATSGFDECARLELENIGVFVQRTDAYLRDAV
jgi:nicotinamidase-related amidase